MKKLLIVDGSNLLFQMFFGMPARIVNNDGKAIHGTLGFTGALLKIIRKVKPEHVLVIFDGEHDNQRTAVDSDYKANRPDYSQVNQEDSPFSQLPDIMNALDHLGIRYFETLDCESDDLIAGFALTYGTDMDIVISSFDSDFFQLITDRVSILRYRGEKTLICDINYLWEKFEIRPGQYADFKSLTGDSSDNIRGVDKVGPKTAAALLRQFGSLEKIIENYPEIAKPSIRTSVMQNVKRLQANYTLIKLQADHDLPYSLSQLEWMDSGKTTGQVLRGIGLQP